MKKLILCLMILLFAYPLYAAPRRWCQWDGTKPFGCQTEKDETILDTDGTKLTSFAEANAAGWYREIISKPVLTAYQKRGALISDKVGNEITTTWEVIDLTQAEIDELNKIAMDKDTFELINGMIALGVFTKVQAANWFSPDIKAAYLARDRLENP